ncbi:MAG TPA: divergent PAP2 family protein [Anaerolineaceae bacterium]|nr:divergent PAP2 family protein [Anaerolineaceae bacterium]HNS37961.1 divergent PAP2 family protein [Anaerolineaceae bacterium]HOD04442.1 divergent PAP2 family protein [Anaerolineaceae bacterium]
MLTDLLNNRIFIAALLGWFVAQLIKVPIEYVRHRRLNWGLWFSAGGMPSSHSSLITSTMLAIGLYEGFGTPVFALAFAIAMIIIYDAAGVRREAGRHAQKINALIEELLAGHPISEKRLKEVLGHTPPEVIGGIVLGVILAVGLWLLWP